MPSLVYLLLVTLLVSTLGYSTQCPSGEGKIKSLKNFDDAYLFPCMYSGFVDVEAETNSNMFYWFFRDENLSEDAPLVLWINGGPGSSSMLGNLLENGPLKLVKQNNVTRVHSLKGEAWNAVANVVYVDQPIGVGFSYGHRNITEGSQIGYYMVKFIQGFLEKYPEMKGRKFFISGESYGGKYLPGIASSIIDFNQNAASENDKINLDGVLIGNGFVDPVVQRLAIRQLSLGVGSIQFDSIPELDIIEKRCQEANGRKDIDAPETCDVSDYFTIMNGGMNSYDLRYQGSNSTEGKEILVEYLNDPEVIKDLHCEGSHKTPKYAASNSTVYENFISDGMVVYIDEHQKILDNNITLCLFYGQFDNHDGPYGAQEWMKKLKWEGMSEFEASSRNLYYYESDDNGEVKLGGNFKSYKNFHFLVVYAAGHLVPSTQLALSRNMLSDIIYHDKLLCHEENNKCSLDETTLNLMNNCTGHGHAKNGKCVCNEGYHGADCTITTERMGSDSFYLNPTTWRYFKIGDGVSKAKFEVTSQSGDVIVYTRRGDVPSQSFFNSYLQGEHVEIYLTKETTGEYLALFNPDLDDSIKLSFSTTDESSMWPIAFWICVAMIGVFALTSATNFVSRMCPIKAKGEQASSSRIFYCCKRRRNRNQAEEAEPILPM